MSVVLLISAAHISSFLLFQSWDNPEDIIIAFQDGIEGEMLTVVYQNLKLEKFTRRWEEVDNFFKLFLHEK